MKFIKILEQVRELNENASVVAVSKSVDTPALEPLLRFGVLDFGENKVQELNKKFKILNSSQNAGIRWHFIGRLQKNKINALLALKPYLWQSCDCQKSALEVDKRLNYELNALLQINSADEASKQGISIEQAIDEYIAICEQCKYLKLKGVMSIGANSDDKKLIIKSFERTYKIFENLKPYGAKICSMGMSDDYELALKSGSNMLRLGRVLFA